MYRDDLAALLEQRSAAESRLAESRRRGAELTGRLRVVGWMPRRDAARRRRWRVVLTLGGLALLLAGLALGAHLLVLAPNRTQTRSLADQALINYDQVHALGPLRRVRGDLLELVGISDVVVRRELVRAPLDRPADAWFVIGAYGCLEGRPGLTRDAVSALDQRRREEMLRLCQEADHE